jgi:signal transduction histidine kinase/DNA-binding response OmpR family regulator
VAGVLISGVNWLELFRKLSAADNAVALHEAADRLLKLFQDAESAELGFTITGSENQLQPFKETEAALPAQFDLLANLARQDPLLLNQVMDLRAQGERLLTQLRTVVQRRRDFGFRAASVAIETGENERLMASVQKKVAMIKSLRSDLGSPEGRNSRDQLLRACVTGLVAGIIGLGVGLYALHLVGMSLKHQQRERELLEAKLKAEGESREKSTLLANMSHEIRTPLNAIMGFSELLTIELKQPRHNEYLRSIRTSARSLLQLINDILDMSKVEAGVLELHPEPTDPREICDFVFTVFGESAAKKGVRLKCDVAADLPRALWLDRVRLRQVLVNLVGNAVKFTDQGSICARVSAEKQDDNSQITLMIEVQDTGVGIPQDKLDAIFTPFVQAGRDHEKEKQGSGLGLAIVKRLTQLMGGSVKVTSVVGQGSTFHLRFPDVVVSARLPVPYCGDEAGQAVEFDALRPAKILVVDDIEMNCALIKGMFEGSAHRLAFSANGHDAVARARAMQPDIVLMDIRMPIMDGLQAASEIRNTPGLKLVPVIAITASSVPEEGNGERSNFNGFLRKPFSRRELFDELAQFLPRREKDPEPSRSDAPMDRLLPGSGDWRTLAEQLRTLEKQEWPGVRDTLAVNESRAFARRLETLARESGCNPLLSYSVALSNYAETYAIASLEKHLQQFPKLIARVEHTEA